MGAGIAQTAAQAGQPQRVYTYPISIGKMDWRTPLGAGNMALLLSSGASNNMIGGTAAGAGNRITSAGDGVVVAGDGFDDGLRLGTAKVTNAMHLTTQ